MADKQNPQNDPASLEQASQRLDAFLEQREKIRDGGDTVIAANGEELLLSDLKRLASEIRQLVQSRKTTLQEGIHEGTEEDLPLNLNVALEAYRECRSSDEPARSRWVEEGLLAAFISRNPSLSQQTPREIIPDDMLEAAMDAYTSARNMGTSSDKDWLGAAMEAAQAFKGAESEVRSTRKMSP